MVLRTNSVPIVQKKEESDCEVRLDSEGKGYLFRKDKQPKVEEPKEEIKVEAPVVEKPKAEVKPKFKKRGKK